LLLQGLVCGTVCR